MVKILHRGWDQHSDLPANIRAQCRDTDQACAGLIKDLIHKAFSGSGKDLILAALRGHVEGALNAVRTTLRTSQPPLDKDVVVRMERLLQDSLA